MTDAEPVTAADLRLMQGLAQRVTAIRPDLVNSDASFGELAWNWGRGHASYGATWRRRLWFSGGDLVAWGWAQLPRRVRRSDGSVTDVTGAYLAYQVAACGQGAAGAVSGAAGGDQPLRGGQRRRWDGRAAVRAVRSPAGPPSHRAATSRRRPR